MAAAPAPDPVPAPAPQQPVQPDPVPDEIVYPSAAHTKLYALMRQKNYTEADIMAGLTHLQFYPADTPIVTVAPDFIEGFLLNPNNWTSFCDLVDALKAQNMDDEIPF